jgi:hypothetical protein
MTTLVLHIGSPKAGSSAIQSSILGASWNSTWAAIPPNPYGKPYPSGFIAGLYLKTNALPRVLAQRQQANLDRFERDLSRYRKLIRRSIQPLWRKSPQALIVSCEYLWRLPQSSVEELRRDFESLGCNRFIVVAYVREPGSLYGSALQQWSRLSTNLQRFDPLVWRYELRKRLLTWQSVFGGCMIVRPYDRAQLHNGCVVSDFWGQIVRRFVGLSDCPALLPVADVNTSATTEELLAIYSTMTRLEYVSQQRIPDNTRLLSRLWDEIKLTNNGRRRGTPIRVRKDVLCLIRRRHQDDLRWLADQYGVRFESPSEIQTGSAGICHSWVDLDRPLQIMDLIEPPDDQALLRDLSEYLIKRVRSDQLDGYT